MLQTLSSQLNSSARQQSHAQLQLERRQSSSLAKFSQDKEMGVSCGMNHGAEL
jgi:hypothetical protein